MTTPASARSARPIATRARSLFPVGCRLLGAVLVMALALALIPGAGMVAQAAGEADAIAVSGSATARLGGGPATLTAAVPAGMTAGTIRGTIEVPEAYPGAVADILVGDRIVATVGAESAGSQPFEVSGLLASDTSEQTDGSGRVQVGLRYRVPDSSDGAQCRPSPSDDTAVLSAVQVGLQGTAVVPTTVGQFMTGPVSRVDVVVSDPDDADARIAGLQAAAAATEVWGAQGAVIDVLSAAPVATTPPYAGAVREIRVVSGSGPATQRVSSEADIPILTLTGRGAPLAAAARALADARTAIAQSAKTEGLTASAAPAPGTTRTFAGLGMGTARLSGAGASELSVTVPQSAFGGGVSAFSIRVRGTHTDLPSQLAATADIYWNDDLVDSLDLSSGTRFDRDVRIPRARVHASNTLTIALRTASTLGGSCPADLSGIPVELALDTSASRIVATRGQSLDPGFARFPQVLGGTLPVAFGSGLSPAAALALAGTIVAQLQAQSPTPLTVTRTSVAALASSSSSGLVVGADSEAAATFQAPLRLQRFRAITGSKVPFGAGTSHPFVALQAAETQGRNLLIAGGWSPSGDRTELNTLAGDLGAALTGARYGWQSWSDDLILATDTGERIVNVSSGAVVPQRQATDEYRPVAWWLVIGIAVLVVLGLAGWLRRRRIRGRAAEYVGSEGEAVDARGGSSPAAGGSRPRPDD